MKFKHGYIFIFSFFIARLIWGYLKEGNIFSDFLGTMFLTFLLLIIHYIAFKNKD